MDRLRRLTKSKTSPKNDDQGDHHVRQENSKSKLPPSNLVARLMGFDGSTSQHPIHRQHKSSAENLLKTSPATSQGDAHLLRGESHKKRFTEHQECKHMYEERFNKSGSNRDAILELLKKPNPLFVKHLQGVQESSSSSLCSQLPIQKQSNPQIEQAKGPSRIVLLKPNYAVAQDARNSLSSHDPSHTMKVMKSKEAAKRFNGEVQEVFSRMRIDFPSYVKEIPGTGGLHDLSGIDKANESEVMKMTSYDLTESYISRQAKKRLLERWRRAQRYEHARASGKGSTLGELLCTPEEKLKNFDAVSTSWDSPLGISSVDGWKDKYSKIKPRSRSLPPPGTRNVKVNAEQENRTDDKLLMFKEDRYRSKNDRVHENFTEREDFSFRTSRSSKRKSQSRNRRASSSYALLENHISRVDTDLVKKDSPDEKPMVPPTPTVSSTIGTGASTTLEYYTASSVSSDGCYPNVSRSMQKRCNSSHGGQEHSNPKGSPYGPSERVYILQHLGAEAGSSGSSKEADPSPNSVLEVPSREDVSLGPKRFKRISADLHDIRKQLSLLSRESKSKFNAPTHIKTDYAGEGSSLELHADEIVVSECWESLYIDDVLIECGLYDMDIDVFMPRSKGPNNPLGPRVFYNLEKKYCNEMSAPKYERMLLFDRIRSAVLEISQSYMNLCPWVKPMPTEFGLKRPKCELRNEVHKLLAIQDTEVKEGIPGKVIDKDTYRGDLRNSVDMVGIKIERSMTDDLLMELVKELQFDV